MSTVALNKLIAGSLSLGVLSWLASKSMFVVPAGHQAVIFSRSQGIKLDTVKGEGLNFVVPYWQWPHLFDVRITPQKTTTTTPTKDLQRVSIGLRVLYRPSVPELPLLYKNYSTEYAQHILPGIGQEVLKSVVAQYHQDTLITQRAQVSYQIRDLLTKRAKEYYIILEDVAITDLEFGPEFANAIEQKQVAQQEAERAKWLVQKADQERKAAIIQAEGEAEAARLITAATNEYGASAIELRKIEAAKEVSQTLASNDKISYVPSNVKLLLPTGK